MKCSFCNKEMNYIRVSKMGSTTVHEWHCAYCGGRTYQTGDVKDNTETKKAGWICPKCGAVLSPDLNYCLFCAPKKDKRLSGEQDIPINGGARIIDLKKDIIC